MEIDASVGNGEETNKEPEILYGPLRLQRVSFAGECQVHPEEALDQPQYLVIHKDGSLQVSPVLYDWWTQGFRIERKDITEAQICTGALGGLPSMVISATAFADVGATTSTQIFGLTLIMVLDYSDCEISRYAGARSSSARHPAVLQWAQRSWPNGVFISPEAIDILLTVPIYSEISTVFPCEQTIPPPLKPPVDVSRGMPVPASKFLFVPIAVDENVPHDYRRVLALNNWEDMTETEKDRLKQDGLLDDKVVSWWMYRIWFKNTDTRTKTAHVFTTTFYKMLVNEPERAHRFTKHVDIFKKDYLVIPIHMTNHWILAIVHQPHYLLPQAMWVIDPRKQTDVDSLDRKTYIFTLDSLGSNQEDVRLNLLSYLKKEAQVKLSIPVDELRAPTLIEAKVPRQPNYTDCGLYLLHFAELFMQDPLTYAKAMISPYANTDIVWKANAVGGLRARMMTAMQELFDAPLVHFEKLIPTAVS